jgi:CHAT domain-containing protein/tetratricopeptide (TPR) repeat protein
MKRNFWALRAAILSALLVGITTLSASGQDVKAKIAEWQSALAKGQVKEALILANACKTDAKGEYGDDDPKTFRVMNEVAETQYDAGKFQAAKSTLREISSALGKKPDPALMAEVEWRRGMVQVAMREYDEAEKALKYAIDNSGKTANPNRTLARAKAELAWLRIAERKFDEAKKLCEEAAALVATSDKLDQRVQGRLLAALAVAQYRSDDPAETAKADTSFKQAIDALTSAYSADYHGIQRVRHQQSGYLFHVGSYPEALTMREDTANKMLEKYGKDHLFYAHALDSLGDSLFQELDLARAEQCAADSSKIKKQLFGDQHAEMVTNKLFIAKISLETGKEQEAQRQFDEAFKLAEEKAGKTSLELADALLGLASASAGSRRVDENTTRLRRAGEVYAQKLGKLSDPAVNCHIKLAELLIAQNKPDEAASLMETDRAAIESGGAVDRSHAYDTVLETLGLTHAMAKRLDQASECWTKAVELRKKRRGADDPSTVFLATKIARLKGIQGDWLETMFDVSQTRHLIDQHLNKALSGLTESEQMFYLEEKERPSYHYSMSLAAEAVGFDQSFTEEATSWVLNGKGASMRMVSRFFEQVRKSNSPEAKKQIRELMMTRGEMAALWNKLSHKSITIRSEKDIKNLQDTLQKRLPDLMKKERSLSREMAISLRSKDQPPVWTTVAEVRARLPQDTVLVEFVKFRNLPFALSEKEVTVVGDVYYAIVIPPTGKDSVTWHNLGPAAVLDRKVVLTNAAARGLIINKTDAGKIQSKYDFESATESSAKTFLAQLGTELFGKMMPTLSKYNHWIVSPDSLLWQAPLPALITGTEGKYMIQERTLTTVLSGRILTEAKSRTKWSDDPAPAMFTDIDYGKVEPGESPITPLPGAAREAKGVEPYLQKLAGGKKPLVLKRTNATEGAADKLQGPSIAMFSTHGYCMDAPPGARWKFSPLMVTGLCMSNANETRGQKSGNDGFMTGLEIAGLNLTGTKLVVLSACNTAEGEVKDGEGVASLQLAFHLAGAESVASTLWSVPDQETADLMIQFFKNLSEGMAPPKALCEAQKFIVDDFKSKGKWAHPVLWAAFCVSSKNPAHE